MLLTLLAVLAIIHPIIIEWWQNYWVESAIDEWQRKYPRQYYELVQVWDDDYAREQWIARNAQCWQEMSTIYHKHRQVSKK